MPQEKEESSTVANDDRKKALALDRWHTTHNASQALELLSWKFSAEAALLKYLGVMKNGKRINATDF